MSHNYRLKGETKQAMYCLSGRIHSVIRTVGNALLAYGYENQAFQA